MKMLNRGPPAGGKAVITSKFIRKDLKYENKKQVEKSINFCAGICHVMWHDSSKCSRGRCRFHIGKPCFHGAERYGVHRLKD